MLSKKAAKRAAISATVRKEHHAHAKLAQQQQQSLTRKKGQAASPSSSSASAGAAARGSSREDDYFVSDSRRHARLNAADAEVAGSGSGSRADLIRSLGDHINTRLQEVTFEDDLDGDVFHERRAQLMEEARLAAGVKQRNVSTSVRQYLGPASELRDLHSVRIAHNCNSITCVAALGTSRIVFGDKSGKVYLVDVSLSTSGTGMAVSERAEVLRRRKVLLEPALPSGIVAIAVSDTSANRPTTRDVFEKTSVDMSCPSYVAAGAADGSISVWETLTKTHKGLLFMHRKPITGLRFRMDSSTLYSCCADSTLRVWNVPQMIAVDKLFGHEGPIHFLDSLRKETAATVGEDGTMRFWKMDAATQQAYSYAAGPAQAGGAASPSVVMEAVAMLNEGTVVAGAMDGAIVVFDVNRRKPLIVVPAAHGYGFIGDGTGLEKAAAQLAAEEDADRDATASPSSASASAGAAAGPRRNANPITAVAAVPYADVIATASYDGVVRVWHVAGVGAGATAPGQRTEDGSNGNGDGAGRRAEPQLVLVAALPVPAIVNALRFSDSGDVLYVAMSKEPRCGRWVVQSSARNGVLVVPLTEAGRKALQGMGGEVEHIPAQLFGIRDDASEGGDSAEAAEAVEEPDADATLDADEEAPVEDGEVADDVADMFDVGPDGMMRFKNAPLARAAAAAAGGKKAKKGKRSGMPKVLRQSVELTSPAAADSSSGLSKAATKATKPLSSKKSKVEGAGKKRSKAADAASPAIKKTLKRAKA